MIVHGVNPSDQIEPLLLDASGNVLVYADPPTTTGGKIHVDASGNVIIDSINDYTFHPTSRNSRYDNASLSAGGNTEVIATVPTGETWRLTTFASEISVTRAGAYFVPYVDDGSNLLIFYFVNAPVGGYWYPVNVNVILNAGDIIKCYIAAAGAGDAFGASVIAERID